MATRNVTSPDNPLATHIPPKYDIYGHTLKYDKSESFPVIPRHWVRDPLVKSRTELMDKRKAERIPDPSYDLDGDGQVGGQDLVLARRFDKDNDGRLNTGELAEAKQAIKDGVHDQYVWGVEQSGPFRPYRIMQKRGVIVDSDDFGPIDKTYPREPLPEPRYKSLNQMKQSRRQDTLDSVSKKQAAWQDAHAIQRFAVVRFDDHFVENPPFTSIHDKKQSERSQARAQMGLSEPTDIKTVLPLTTSYTALPPNKTKHELAANRRKETLESLASKQNYDHLNSDKRLQAREEKQVVIVRDGENKTWTSIKEQQRLRTNEYNHKTFSERSIGIHGKELPKFAEHKPAYWEDGSVPQHNSQVKLVKEQRYWGAPDPLKIADVEEGYEAYPKVYLRTSKTPELPEKPNKIVHNGWRPRDPADPHPPPPKHNYRWSTMVHHFSHGSVFDVPSAEANKPSEGDRKDEGKVRMANVSLTSHEGQNSSFLQTANSGRSHKTTGGNPIKKSGTAKLPQRQALKTSGFVK